MAKPRRKPVKFAPVPPAIVLEFGRCAVCKRAHPSPSPTDTDRLDALLRALRTWESSTGLALGLTTRRDIDKLLREEGKRGK